MKNIDFLPQRYRDNRVRRSAGMWRFVVVLCLGGSVAAASLVQFAYRARVKQQLLEVQPLLASAQASEARRTQLQSELTHVSHTATLYAIVEAPWPRTQILAAVVEPVDETIVLHEIHHTRQAIPSSRAPSQREFQLGSEDKNAPTLTPTQSDLKAMREKLHHMQDVVRITGSTSEQAHLHVYLEKLDAAPLLERVELIKVETNTEPGKPVRVHFTASILIRAPLGSPASQTAELPTQTQIDGGLAG